MQIVTGYKGQAHISSNDEQGKNQGIFGTGSYVMNIGNKFSPTAVTANEIQIADGEGIIQGVHFRVDPGTYDTVTIENGEQGLQRKDLIVCRYTKDSSTSIENTEWVVIKGTPAASNPARPAYITGDILAGAVEVDMPMYEVVLNGINLSAINPLFSTLIPQAELLSRLGTAENRITQINSKITHVSVTNWNDFKPSSDHKIRYGYSSGGNATGSPFSGFNATFYGYVEGVESYCTQHLTVQYASPAIHRNRTFVRSFIITEWSDWEEIPHCGLGIIPNGTDYNDLIVPGTYLSNASYTYQHSPVAGGILEVICPRISGNYCIQRVTISTTIWSRYRTQDSGTSFTDWKKVTLS